MSRCADFPPSPETIFCLTHKQLRPAKSTNSKQTTRSSNRTSPSSLSSSSITTSTLSNITTPLDPPDVNVHCPEYKADEQTHTQQQLIPKRTSQPS